MTTQDTVCPFCGTWTGCCLPNRVRVMGRHEQGLYGSIYEDQYMYLDLPTCSKHDWIVQKLREYYKDGIDYAINKKKFRSGLHVTDWECKEDIAGLRAAVYVYISYPAPYNHLDNWLTLYRCIEIDYSTVIQHRGKYTAFVELQDAMIDKAANDLWDYLNLVHPQGVDELVYY